MRLSRISVAVALVLLLPAGLSAGDLPEAVQAKFIKLLAASAGSPGKVACKDASMAGELGKVGITVSPGSKVAWAASESEVKSLKASGKLVICGKLAWLPEGAAIAIVEEGGKPQIYLHMGHVAASGVALSDSVLKIGRRL